MSEWWRTIRTPILSLSSEAGISEQRKLGDWVVIEYVGTDPKHVMRKEGYQVVTYPPIHFLGLPRSTHEQQNEPSGTTEESRDDE